MSIQHKKEALQKSESISSLKNKPAPKKKTSLDRFADLTWADLEEWFGTKIVSRGENYQRQGRVSDLAVTKDGSLLAWVAGSNRYATMVSIDEDDLLDSICTCPYELDCKHGAAVVFECLKQIENNQNIPQAEPDDERLTLLDDDFEDATDEDESTERENVQQDIDNFLKGKTKAQLITLIHEFAQQYPEIARDISDRHKLNAGETKAIVTRLRQEIHEVGAEVGWQHHWNGEGYTPDYSGIQKKLEALLEAGHADEVLSLGRELIRTGTEQIAQSDDEGETAMEIAACMPTVVEALENSSLDDADKLEWAVDNLLEDEFDLCEEFAEYLHDRHAKAAWNALADRLLARLKGTNVDSLHSGYWRDQLSSWAIHALEQAERTEEVIPLCEAEAEKTNSYVRLVKRLTAAQRFEDAERWIHEGIKATKENWGGIAHQLRNALKEIRTLEKNWPVVAAMEAEEFVRDTSRHAYKECGKAVKKTKKWTKVRAHLLTYLENGVLPWSQKDWPLPASGLDLPEAPGHVRFPMISELIDIAILEKKPDQVLRWYDQRPKDRLGWDGINHDAIAAAVKDHAPDRATAIWKEKAEKLIAQVNVRSYQEAAKYLRKTAEIMDREKKQSEWENYLNALKKEHNRKWRLMEILNTLGRGPIIKKR